MLLELFYILTGFLMIITAYYTIKDKNHPSKIGTALFGGILGFIFIFGKILPYAIIGALLLVLGILTITKQIKVGTIPNIDIKFSEAHGKKLGNKIFLPSLALALIAFIIAKYTNLGGQVAIGVSALGALLITLGITKSPLKNIAVDSDRMLQQVGASSILPQLLAALGTVFTAAGVGEVISQGFSTIIPKGNILLGITAYCIAMAAFSIIMGNAFAAFAVITAGVGIPFVFAQGANPAVAAALGLSSGYCGTLLTPMAANYNLVPAALLETKNKNSIIIAQAPVAIILLISNIALMYFLAF